MHDFYRTHDRSLIVLQLAYTTTNLHQHVNDKEEMTAKTWTAFELGEMALDKKMAVVVSDIVGSSPEMGVSTTAASSHERWGWPYWCTALGARCHRGTGLGDLG